MARFVFSFGNEPCVGNGCSKKGAQVACDEGALLAPQENEAARVSPPVVTAAAWAWRFAVLTLAAVIIGYLALKFSVIIVSILIALLLTVALHPLTSIMQRKLKFPAAAAAGGTVILLLAFVTGLLGGASTGLVQGFLGLRESIVAGVGTLLDWAQSTFPQMEETLNNLRTTIIDAIQANGAQIAGGVLAASATMSTIITALLIVLFSLFFFLMDGRGIWRWFVRLLPVHYRTNANEAGIRAFVTLGSYARNQALMALFDSVMFSILAACLHTPFALVFPIGAIVFVLAFIPVVGLIVAGVIATLVVLVSSGSFIMAGIMLLGVLVISQIEGNVLSPLVQGNSLNIHAWAILLLVIGGSTVAGIAGALFAVPIAAAINVTVLYLRGHDTFPYLNTLETRPGGPREEFEVYAAEHWAQFDREVAQHLPPKEARKAKRAAKKAERAAKAGAK